MSYLLIISNFLNTITISSLIFPEYICLSFEVENSQVGPWQTTTAGETVTVECLESYVLKGAATLTCQSDGSWSSDAPTCQHVGKFILMV